MKEVKSNKNITTEVIFSENEDEQLDKCLEKLLDAKFESLKRAICNSDSS